MPVDPKLLEKARATPKNLRFDEAQTLAVQLGFEHVRTNGDHRIFHHPQAESIRGEMRPLNLQPGRDGKAKQYQVVQMIQMAEAMGIIPPGDDENEE